MRGFRLGSIFGLDIRIDYSWFIIFFLILWTLSTGLFPLNYPGLGEGTYIAMGVAATLLFFASLLAHELTHSLVARSRNIPMAGITLFIFGGMAETQAEARTPGDEFTIAAVGPLSSLVIGGIFWLLALLASRTAWGPAVTGVVTYLAYINVVLAIFNLVPGFPLDGGRVFRAAVWKLTDDVTRATRWAATGGRIVGYLLMAIGAVELFTGAIFSGLWLIFIGWFVRTAAIGSLAQFLLRQDLEGVRVADIMTRAPETVDPGLPLQDFVDRYVLRGRHHAYPVTAHDRLLGLVTLRHVNQVPRDEWPHRTVADVMTPLGPDLVVAANDPVASALERLQGTPDVRLLVTNDGHLEGLVTRRDITRWLERAQLVHGTTPRPGHSQAA